MASKLSVNKTVAEKTSPQTFIAGIKHPVRRADAELLLPWFTKITGYPAVMWGSSIVGYGRYHYEYDSGRSGDCQITGFSPRASSLSFYIMPGYQDLSEYLVRLGKHKMGKACLTINKLADVDMAVLAEIVEHGDRYMRENYQTWKR